MGEELEADWESLRRQPDGPDIFEGSLSEAISRLTLAAMECSALDYSDPSNWLDQARKANLFPILSIIPNWRGDSVQFVAKLSYEHGELFLTSSPHPTCDLAVVDLIQKFCAWAAGVAKKWEQEADSHEKEMYSHRDGSRKMLRILNSLGDYNPNQLRLNLRRG